MSAIEAAHYVIRALGSRPHLPYEYDAGREPGNSARDPAATGDDHESKASLPGQELG